MMKMFFHILTKLEFFLASTGLLLTIFLTFCQVVNRYWLNFEIMWISDFALYIFIFTIYLAIPYGASQKTHIAVDVLPELLCSDSKVKKAFFEIFKSGVTILMVCGLIAPTWTLLKRAIRYPEYATLVRWFNMSWLFYAMSAMIVLVILHYFWHLASSVFELKKIYWSRRIEGKGSLDV
jgi:TRAP-type C4-dicarboxylate transport system permease small subunit